ncbi:MAG: DUF971 domain-containing protein [Chthoniobacterales bacterium]
MSDSTPPCASAPLRGNPLSLTAVAPFGNELALSWSDGVEQFVPLEKLRRACPCAVCNGEPDVMGRGDAPARNYKQGSFELKSYEFVGGYALLFRWADGHATGIYSYDLLRKL